MRRSAFAAFAVAAIASLVGGCAGPTLVSRDLALVATREGEGRPAVTALAFTADGHELLVGDYRGGVERLALPKLATSGDGQLEPSRTEVLALAPPASSSAPPLTVVRNSRGSAHERLSGATVLDGGGAVAWSRVAQKLWYAPPSNEGRLEFEDELSDLDVVAASGAEGWLVDLADRSDTRLELRRLPSLDLEWSLALGHAASAIGVDARAGVVVVADEHGLELHALRDGHVTHRLEGAAGGVPHSLRDGRRFLLVQEESLAVLDLGEKSSTAPAAAPSVPHVESGFVAHRGGVTAVAVALDGSWVATGGARGDLRLFQVKPTTPRGSEP